MTDLQLNSEYEMFVVAVNDVGRTTSDHIRVLVGTPHAQFGRALFVHSHFSFRRQSRYITTAAVYVDLCMIVS